jgi:tRNA pseudouridine55 synthase
MNGIVVVDKPAGKTSFDIVRDIRRVLNIKKVGHTGTLDPLATGVLPVCINEATKLVQFFSQDEKEYRVIMLLGIETDTLDIDGNIISRQEPDVTRGDVERVARSFIGTIEQKPPKYSAIKFKGKSLHKWMREGVDVDPPTRTVEVKALEIEEFELPYVTFSVLCSKGTYVRSLCSDMGTRLGCGACMSALRRKRSGHFLVKDAVSIDGLDDHQKRSMLKEKLVPLDNALPNVFPVMVDHTQEKKIRNGHQPGDDLFETGDIASLTAGDLIKFVTDERRLIAIARIVDDGSTPVPPSDQECPVAKIVRVFNHDR